MKQFCGLLAFSLLTSAACCQGGNDIAIIPEPVSVTRTEGVYRLPSKIIIQADGKEDLKQIVAFLSEHLSRSTGRKVEVMNSFPKAAILLRINKVPNNMIGIEGYQLMVTPQNIMISANNPAGLYYGVQTLMQLFPKEIESSVPVKDFKWTAPCINITDFPRFQWRGLMFDVSRHFFMKKEVEEFIDQMVRYKYNILHLHLTDDQGWRIEIKGLPKLTEVGAWNVKKLGYFGRFSPADSSEPRNYGGFYTQEDIKDLVQYAKERFVNILPEIDVPGHSLAAIVSYPELSCTQGADKYFVSSGEAGLHFDNTLCPANQSVYDFLDKVISQVAALFPFEYIHMGGDECSKEFWKKSDAIKNLMEKEGLKTMEEVQSYFEKKVEKIVESKGKKFMGWDEILEGGLAPNAVVMSWRGIKGGIEAVKMGHEVVMSPTTFSYLDYMQADPVIEPRVYATLHLNKAYKFDPVPDGVDAKYIKGGQANLWTEQVYNMRTVEYMVWPRAWAIAESVWSPVHKKDWEHFFHKVEKHFYRYDEAEIKYSRAVYDPIFTVTSKDTNNFAVQLTTEAPGLDIYYSFDNSFPDRFYPRYSEPLSPPKDAVMLKVITYQGHKPVGRMMAMPVEELRRRAEKKQNYPRPDEYN